MTLAKTTRRLPREIAEGVAEALRADAGAGWWLGGVEVAGPGFLNLDARAGMVRAARPASSRLATVTARGRPRHPRTSSSSSLANPTGPLHVGHARQAAYGDSLGRILWRSPAIGSRASTT